MFPAWLMHSVDRSASDDDRISLSFNFNVYSEHYVKNGIYPSQNLLGKHYHSRLCKLVSGMNGFPWYFLSDDVSYS